MRLAPRSPGPLASDPWGGRGRGQSCHIPTDFTRRRRISGRVSGPHGSHEQQHNRGPILHVLGGGGVFAQRPVSCYPAPLHKHGRGPRSQAKTAVQRPPRA